MLNLLKKLKVLMILKSKKRRNGTYVSYVEPVKEKRLINLLLVITRLSKK